MYSFGSCSPSRDKQYYAQLDESHITDEEFDNAFKAPTYKWYHRLFQFVCFFLFFGPIRLLLAVITFFVCGVLIISVRTTVKTLGMHKDSGKALCMNIGRVAFRLFLFAFGVVWIKVTGKEDPEVRFVISNHISMSDPFIIILLRNVCCVIKKEVSKIKFLQPVLENVDPVFVERSKKSGATQEIIQRADNFERWPVMIFPEGTITNGTISLKLHTSAFITPYKIQPITIRYWMPFVPEGWNSYAWPPMKFWSYLWCLTSMPFSILDVHQLPSMSMAENGKGDINELTKQAHLVIANDLMIKAVDKSSHDRFREKSKTE